MDIEDGLTEFAVTHWMYSVVWRTGISGAQLDKWKVRQARWTLGG